MDQNYREHNQKLCSKVNSVYNLDTQKGLRKEDGYKFIATLGYMVKSRPARATLWNPTPPQKNKQIKLENNEKYAEEKELY